METSNGNYWDLTWLDDNTLLSQRHGNDEIIPWVELWVDDGMSIHTGVSYYTEEGDYIDTIPEDFAKFVSSDELAEVAAYLQKEFEKSTIPPYMIGLNLPSYLKDVRIKKIQHLYKNILSRRQLKITLTNGTVIRATACHESWEQYGGNRDELSITQHIVEQNNAWLHGKWPAVTYDEYDRTIYLKD